MGLHVLSQSHAVKSALMYLTNGLETFSYLLCLYVWLLHATIIHAGSNRRWWERRNKIIVWCLLSEIFNCRSFYYPFVIKGSKPVPLMIFIVSLIFCTINGYMQSRYLLHYYSYSDRWFYDPRFMIGIVMFMCGMAVNIHSDAVLRGLRKSHDTGYKIPKGMRK